MLAEICNGRYCKDHGYFCPFMDRSGFCIATSCRYAQDLLDQINIENQARALQEEKDAKNFYNEVLLSRIKPIGVNVLDLYEKG